MLPERRSQRRQRVGRADVFLSLSGIRDSRRRVPVRRYRRRHYRRRRTRTEEASDRFGPAVTDAVARGGRLGHATSASVVAFLRRLRVRRREDPGARRAVLSDDRFAYSRPKPSSSRRPADRTASERPTIRPAAEAIGDRNRDWDGVTDRRERPKAKDRWPSAPNELASGVERFRSRYTVHAAYKWTVSTDWSRCNGRTR